jgi:hypothetical protein
MRFFGALDTADTMPNRAAMDARVDNRSSRSIRTIGQFAVYMHDFALDKFDARFRDDAGCWNGTAANCTAAGEAAARDRGYTWWCNRQPNNPCVFGCPNQVDECYNQASPGARTVRYDGASPLDQALSAPLERWANGSSRGWPSAWPLSGNNLQGNTVHVQGYDFGDGWATSLVTNVSASNPSTGLDYWAQGRLRVTYGAAGSPAPASSSATASPSFFELPSGADNATSVYWLGLDGAPSMLEAQNISTTHRVYGGFSVAVTHESRAFQTTADCYVNDAEWSGTPPEGGFTNATCSAAGSYSMTTCPFTFRCFTPEANAGAPGPRCMPNFPADYGGVAAATPAAPAWVRACGEYCPGCPTCPMLRCWRTAPVDTPDSAYTNSSAPYDDTKLQDDRVPYIRVRHYDEGFVQRNYAAGTEETALAWHPNSWRLNTCGSHMGPDNITTTGLAMRNVSSNAPYMSAMSQPSIRRDVVLPADNVCAPIPKYSYTSGGYSDAYTLPALFPHPPFVKMTDTLVWLTELEELSFTDLAVVDHGERRTIEQLASVSSAVAYRDLREAAGEEPPQSLNDFAGSCGRLEAAGVLANYTMTRAQCDARAAAFGASVKTIRFNMTASQVPPMSGAFQDEEWAELGATFDPANPAADGSAPVHYGARTNRWHSAVLGTLPGEWGNFFPNVERM